MSIFKPLKFKVIDPYCGLVGETKGDIKKARKLLAEMEKKYE